MSNLGSMITRIHREMKRDGLTAEVRDAIITAIEFHKDDRFAFNEDDATAGASSGASSIAFPTNFLHVDLVEMSSTATDRFELDPDEFDEIRRATIDAAPAVQPSKYSVFQDRINFNSSLDRDYEIKVFGHAHLTEISSSSTTTDTNAWMVEGEELIRNHAKGLVYDDVLRNANMATASFNKALLARRKLENRYTLKVSTGQVSKTAF